MSTLLRDGAFDVVIAAGPRVSPWPSIGVRTLSTLLSDMGLSVGFFGGENVAVRGVLPLPGTGALVLVEDVQRRIHRLRARSVVRVSAMPLLPDPFSGWHSQGLVPLTTARRLLDLGRFLFEPATVILGTGNSALRFGSELLDRGVPEVSCVETSAQWGAKRYAGWEVEKRRFETAGGKIIEATPVRLSSKGALLWELRLKDVQGIRVLEAARVVSAGPFRDLPAVREYPTGSFLFELEQSADEIREENIDGWMLEEERARLLGIKIAKALLKDVGEKKDALDKLHHRTRVRLRKYAKHRQEPFTPTYQGKWISVSDGQKIRDFAGVPKIHHQKGMVASIECLESISCNVCQAVCPESAIGPGRVLDENRCSGCAACLKACPSNAITMIHERETMPTALVGLPWRGERDWKLGEFATLVNRRGEPLGSGRISKGPELATEEGVDRRVGAARSVRPVFVEVPPHLVWEARGLRRARAATAEDQTYLLSLDRANQVHERVEVTLNGEKRLLLSQIPLSSALFEIGQARAEDVLHCSDGSCGRCQVIVDGVKKSACQTQTRRGMSIQLSGRRAENPANADLCLCQGISYAEIIDRLRQGKLRSAEAVLSVSPVGGGSCRGQFCLDPFRRLLLDQGLDVTQWIDWRFPWSEWTLSRS